MTTPGVAAPPSLDEGALDVAAAEVDAARRWLDRVVELAGPDVEVRVSASGPCVTVELERTRVAIYDTVVRITVTVSLELDRALTRAHVRLHEDSDTSS